MRISFIGGGARVKALHKLFDKVGFETGGFFCNPLSECADIAIETNTMLYGCIDDLCNDSDVVVIATADKVLPQVVNTLSKLHTNGKIVLSVADKVHAKELDTGYENTYGVICAPAVFESLTEKELTDASIVCEIYGKRSEEFKDAIKLSGIKCSFITPEQMDLYRTALRLMQDGITALLIAGSKLMKISADKNSPDLMPIIRNATINTIGSQGAKVNEMYTKGKINDIMSYVNVLENMGIESITGMFKKSAAYLAESTCADKDMADEVIRKLKK